MEIFLASCLWFSWSWSCGRVRLECEWLGGILASRWSPDIANEVTDLCHSQTPPQFLIAVCTQCQVLKNISMSIHEMILSRGFNTTANFFNFLANVSIKILHTFEQKWKAHFCSSNEFWDISYLQSSQISKIFHSIRKSSNKWSTFFIISSQT